MANLAYPTSPVDVRETLAKEQFIDSLISMDMRLRVKQARPTSLNDSVCHAVELEAFNRAESQSLKVKVFSIHRHTVHQTSPVVSLNKVICNNSYRQSLDLRKKFAI